MSLILFISSLSLFLYIYIYRYIHIHMLHKKTVLVKKRHFYFKKLLFYKLNGCKNTAFFTKVYFCKRAAFLRKLLFYKLTGCKKYCFFTAAFFKIYFCKKAAVSCKKSVFLQKIFLSESGFFM